MFKRLFFLCVICFYVSSVAQYTDLINSNRPGFSESPYGVGPGVYQFETSLFYRKANASPVFDNPKAYGLELHFRTGAFLENLEVNLTTALQNDVMSFTNVFDSQYNKIGLGKLTLGAKYLLYTPKYTDKGKVIRSWNKRHSFDFRRWIPHVAPYIAANFGNLLNTPHKNGGITAKAGILLQNELSNQFNFITNVYYNYIGSEYTEWSYIVSGTYIFNYNWSGFIEHQAKFNDFENTGNVGGGIAYLFNNNLQINSSVRATFQDSGLGIFTSLGASYRIDSHKDRFVELDEYGNEIEDADKKTYNKGFFGRILDKITGIFKRKDKVDVEVTDENGNTENKEVKVGPGGRERKKSVLRTIVKGDKKAKKEKIKSEEKAKKKAIKESKKAKREAEKEKKRELKRIQKEKEDAQKEIEREKKRIEDEKEDAEKEKRKEEKRLKKEQENLEKEKRKEEKRLKKEQEELEKELQEEEEAKEKERLKEEKRKKKEEERLQKEIEKLEKELQKEGQQEEENGN